jgi:hypothetical protein
MKLLHFKPAVLTALVVLGLGASATQVGAFETFDWSLIQGDPMCPHRPGCYEQTHKVRLQAGVTYTIDLQSKDFDAYLYLEDGVGNVLAEDDDSGGNLNARIVFTPTVTGEYLLVATTFNKGATGSYKLIVNP